MTEQEEMSELDAGRALLRGEGRCPRGKSLLWNSYRSSAEANEGDDRQTLRSVRASSSRRVRTTRRSTVFVREAPASYELRLIIEVSFEV